MSTYFYLLENIENREFGVTKYLIDYKTKSFDLPTYEKSVGQNFCSWDVAYEHWVSQGRSEGHEWSPGKDTLLKVILKAKDEPELIDAWVAHHASIVGYENLIILDCGSIDKNYLSKLDYYSKKILVISYRRYYDSIHSTRANPNFFKFIEKNCRFATILDADEFLFGREGNYFSSSFVKNTLRDFDGKVFFGTWLNCSLLNSSVEEMSSFDVSVDVSDQMIRAGTVAGKTIARGDVLLKMGHLGHNLHVSDVMNLSSVNSFGKIFVFHLKGINSSISCRRIMSHLKSMGVVSGVDEKDLVSCLEGVVGDDNFKIGIREYARKYLQLSSGANAEVNKICINLKIPSNLKYPAPEFFSRLDEFDFSSMLSQRLESVKGV